MAPAKQSGLQPGGCLVGWSALSSDRAHPLLSAHTAELPPDPQQGACRFARLLSHGCLCKSVLVLWQRHKVNTRTQVPSGLPAPAACAWTPWLLLLFFPMSLASYIHTKSPWTKMVHSCPWSSRNPGPQGRGQVPGPQYQGNLETFIFKSFLYLSEIKI